MMKSRITKQPMKRLLENKIIRLRAIEPEDLDLLYRWENDTEIWDKGATLSPYSRFTIKQYLIDSKQDIFSDRQLRLMVELKSNGAAIGTLDLYDFDPFHRRAGVGILIDPDFRKKGYGLETLMLLEAYAFGFLNLNQLYAIIPSEHSASLQLFIKAGFSSSGILKEWLARGDRYESAEMMQKINKSNRRDTTRFK